ncbi:undecaprenyl-phosphate 4-deoxy-4-formamido-L-arabinose transferase [Clostridium ragsdalei P11]|uniref:Undecaprenyl-phosphate 4-deoxy-4-formamido-L-arabinose transferase n=1 Tax=Clostridium ragsdalei P11 TaxID=1353534 RepID=A0A1A6AVI8_9CLOT|nr:glycosyltransferase [Clostridium ragsdalei]OBR94101.1 undecaprenyl-phosphate 4-deoxy-4-formamido-L-arabinose transferase [Clostridium ragsdalei P11]
MEEKPSYKNKVDVSIIVPCKNEVNNLKWTLDSIMKSKNFLNFEIIVVDDASNDSSTQFLKSDLNKPTYKDIILIKTNNIGAARARNAGAKVANGNYLFFCDAHVKVPDHLLDNLVDTLKVSNANIAAPCILDMHNNLAAGYGQTWDNKLNVTWIVRNPGIIYEIPIACGCAFCITKEAFQKINGFDNLFQVWGKEDEELCFKAWLYGYKIVVNPEVKVRHLFRPKHPYKVTSSNVAYNMLCMAYSHFKKQRILKTINLINSYSYFPIVVSSIKSNLDLIFTQREKYFKERIHDDDFFFKKFMISF